jgi:hypothetical protein
MRTFQHFAARSLTLAASFPAYIVAAMGAERIFGSSPPVVVLCAWAMFIGACGVWPFLDARARRARRVAATWTGALAITPFIWLATVAVLDRSTESGEALAVVALLAVVVLPQQAIGIALGAVSGALVRRQRAPGQHSLSEGTPRRP